MSKISAVIIARNEETMIGGALDSISFCNDIVVVDNGSIDKTKEIAESKKAKVYELKTNDFSKLREFGLSKAENNWVLYLDADERIDEKLRTSIKIIIEDDSE